MIKKQLILALAISLSSTVFAAKVLPNVNVTNVSMTVVEKQTKNVTVSFDAIVTQLKSRDKLTLTPTMTGHGHSLELTTITVAGKRKMAAQKRSKKQEPTNTITGNVNQNIKYQTTIPYQSWMNVVSINAKTTLGTRGDKTKTLDPLSLANDKIINYDIKPKLNTANIKPKSSEFLQLSARAYFLHNISEYEYHQDIFKRDRQNTALTIMFKQGKTQIDPAYNDNSQILTKINDIFNLVKSDPDVVVKKIIISGHASPEGPLAKNSTIAQKRVDVIKQYIVQHAKCDPNVFEVVNYAEDWDGLTQLIQESNMPWKTKALDIIKKYPIKAGRETQLMKLNRGNPYRYMLANFFPKLRNAGYIQVYYDIKIDPYVGPLNDAIILLNRKQYQRALPLLLEIKGDKQLENAIGVCYMMTRDYQKAETYFQMAIENKNTDATDAAANLDQMIIRESIMGPAN